MREVRTLMVQEGVRALTAAATLLVAIALMFVYDWVLALVFVAAAPVYAGLMRFSKRKLRPMFDSLEEAFGRYHSHQIDAIKGIETVKAVGAEHAFRRRMLDQFTSLATRLFRADFTIMSYEAAIQFVSLASFVIFLYVGALRVLGGDLSVGGLVAFTTLVLLANGPILVLLAIWDELQYGTVLLNRLNDIVEQEAEQGDDHARLTPGAHAGGAGRAAGRRVSVLRPIAPPSSTGSRSPSSPARRLRSSGAAARGRPRSSVSSPACSSRPAGAILYDGVDMRTLYYRDLRRQIGYVLQDSYVFDDTIASNIAFGDERARPRADRVGGAGGERARVRRPAPARVRNEDRRIGSPALRRPAAADRDRARGVPAPAGADLRRGDERARHRVGSARCRPTWTMSSKGERPS